MTRVARVVAVLGAAAILAAPAVPLPVTSDGTAAVSSPDGRRPVVVIGRDGVASAAAAVQAAGGTVRSRLPIVDGVAADVPAAAVPGLRESPAVRSVSADAAVALASSSFGGASTASTATTYPRSTGAAQAWAGGSTGTGVRVAVLDTGIAPVADLAGRVVAGPDLSGEGNSLIDSYGHGTVMAGIIAGNGVTSRLDGTGATVGMAPSAGLVSVKLAGRSGATDVSTVLAGMQWVGSFHDKYGIRVVNLSWGTRSQQSATVDPLDFAVERLWREGLVVVAAAGNTGPEPGTITKPGDDPVVLTAGAYNEHENTLPDDDSVPAWSAQGPTVDGVSKPDVVAPGRLVVSTVARGSRIALSNPQAMQGADYIRGSGTSQATAVVSGAAALLLSARPGLTPDQLKQALRSTATRLPQRGAPQGRGRISVPGALAADVSGSRPQPLPATGLGSLEASRGGYHVVTICPGSATPQVIEGEQDARCRPWDPSTWSGESWSGESWSSQGFQSAFWGQRPAWDRRLPGEMSAPRP